MSENTKTVKVAGEELPLDVFNAKFISSLENQGQCKVASDLSTAYIRMINREDGFLRKILPAETVTKEDFWRDPDSDRPAVMFTIEPTGSPAVSLPFNSYAETRYYYATKALVSFFEVKTPRFQKNVYELMTYKDIDLRKVVVDNALKDMQKAEDAMFIGNVDAITDSGDNNGNANKYIFQSGLSRDTWVEVSKIMGKKMLRNGIALMNDATFREFGKLTRNEIGGDLSEKLFKEGMSGLGDSKVFGMNILSTLKADIVNDNVCYLFSEPDYLGKFLVLQKPTMYVDRTEDILTVNVNEKIGVSIVNKNAVAKVVFSGAAGANSNYPAEWQNFVQSDDGKNFGTAVKGVKPADETSAEG